MAQPAASLARTFWLNYVLIGGVVGGTIYVGMTYLLPNAPRIAVFLLFFWAIIWSWQVLSHEATGLWKSIANGWVLLSLFALTGYLSALLGQLGTL